MHETSSDGATPLSPDVRASWEKFLNPDSLKQNLLVAGLYLAAFEMLKDSLIGRPRDLFWSGFRGDEDIIDPEYQSKVLSLNKHRYTASVLWWRQQGAIDDADVIALRDVREHRDFIAHNLPKVIGTVEHGVRIELLESVAGLLTKIDNWWIRNVEIPTNDSIEVSNLSEQDLDRATSFSALLLSLIVPIAAGDDGKLAELYNMWVERMNQNAQARPSGNAKEQD